MIDFDTIIEQLEAAAPLTTTQRIQLALLLSDPPRRDPAPAVKPTSAKALTVEEAADLMGIGRTRVYELIKAGDLKSVQIGRLRRVRREDVQTYLDNLA